MLYNLYQFDPVSYQCTVGLDDQTAIASLVEDTHLKEDYIIPKVNDPRILPFVTETLKKAIESTLKDVTETRQVDK